jgi:hypothetical protein
MCFLNEEVLNTLKISDSDKPNIKETLKTNGVGEFITI